VVILDEDGREHHRIVGFLPPEEFVPELMLANGKTCLQNRRTAKARAFFNAILKDYPRSKSASQATELARKV
jgi:TolA-binding protein